MTNDGRADYGFNAISAGNPDHRDSIRDGMEGWWTSLSDSLANMMHAAWKLNVDFDSALRNARDHYIAEKNEAEA